MTAFDSAPAFDALGNERILLHPEEASKRLARIANRWAMRAYARELVQTRWSGLVGEGVKFPRLTSCGARLCKRVNADLATNYPRGVYQRPGEQVGRIGGVCWCGHTILCPKCAPYVAAARAEEVAAGFKAARALGYNCRMETFTMPHTGENVAALGHEIDLFGNLWRAFQSGKVSKRLRDGYLGCIVSRELTYGRNGWHFHFHVLVFHPPANERRLKANCAARRARWLSLLKSAGRFGPGAKAHAYHVIALNDEAAARYVAKCNEFPEGQYLAAGARGDDGKLREVAAEMALAHSKVGRGKGRTLFQLLAGAMAGDDRAASAWLIAVRDITVRKVGSVRWSPGLKGRLGVTDVADDELAEEPMSPADILLGALTAGAWQVILRVRAEFSIVVAAQIDRDAVNTAIRSAYGAAAERYPRSYSHLVPELLEDVPAALLVPVSDAHSVAAAYSLGLVQKLRVIEGHKAVAADLAAAAAALPPADYDDLLAPDGAVVLAFNRTTRRFEKPA